MEYIPRNLKDFTPQSNISQCNFSYSFVYNSYYNDLSKFVTIVVNLISGSEITSLQ